jgi:hypothetical protein
VTALDSLLADFEPYLVDDDGSLATFLAAMAAGFEPVDEVVRDTDAGPGWSQILDPNRAPAWALGWLAQLVGIALPKGTPEATARSLIRTPAGWRRGSVGAIQDAARPLLTGSQMVLVIERTSGTWAAADDPYHFTVATYTDETPNPAAVVAAVNAQTPAGLVGNVITTSHHTWLSLVAHYATWADVKAAFPTWAAVETGA